MCRSLEQRFPCRSESVTDARRAVAHVLAEWGVGAPDPAAVSADDLVLAASELSANAAKSDSCEFLLVLNAHRTYIELCVRDHDPHPARMQPANCDVAGGRGLRIVAALCSGWGQTPHDGSTKSVWCRFDVPPGSVLGRGCRL